MLREKKQLSFLSLLVFSLAFLLVLSPLCVAFAKPVEDPNIGENDKTLELTLDYRDESDKTLAIEGATLEIYKIADLFEENGMFEYTVASPYKEKGITSDFLGLTAAKTQDLIKEFEEVIQEDKISNQGRNITNSEGKVTFKNLKSGIYLVRQVGQQGQARKFNIFVPFLVAVPSYQVEENGLVVWEYDVKANPKMEPKPDTEPPVNPPITPPSPPDTPPCPPETTICPPKTTVCSPKESAPKTGDEFSISLYCGIGLMATALLISNYYRKKNSSKKKAK